MYKRQPQVQFILDQSIEYGVNMSKLIDDVKEVKAGYECGLVFEDFNDIQELDQIEAYIMVEVPR